MITTQSRSDARQVWDHHLMRHTPRSCSVIIGLGSHDLGVADVSAGFYLAEVNVESVLLVSKPYEERRAYTTARKLWPEVDIVSASNPMTFEEYAASIGDDRMVIDMLVGALQRLLVYPAQGFMTEQPVPEEVAAAYERLVEAGFTSRLIR